MERISAVIKELLSYCHRDGFWDVHIGEPDSEMNTYVRDLTPAVFLENHPPQQRLPNIQTPPGTSHNLRPGTTLRTCHRSHQVP